MDAIKLISVKASIQPLRSNKLRSGQRLSWIEQRQGKRQSLFTRWMMHFLQILNYGLRNSMVSMLRGWILWLVVERDKNTTMIWSLAPLRTIMFSLLLICTKVVC